MAKRFLFGLISSLLLASGFAHAADRFDPISTSSGGSIVRTDDPGLPCEGGGDDDGER